MKNETQALVDEAKRLIEEYCCREFGEDARADFSDLRKIPIAYTTSEDDLHEIQVNLNLIDCCMDTCVDGTLVRHEPYESLARMVEELPYLEFDDLVSVDLDIEIIIKNAKNRTQNPLTESSSEIPIDKVER